MDKSRYGTRRTLAWTPTMLIRFTAVLLVTGLLAACASGPDGVRVVNGGGGADSDRGRKPEAIRNFSGSEISAALTGKTFQYTRSDGNGFVTYNANGTFDFQDDSKGAGQGKWMVNGSQFCEVFGAGAPTKCGVFKSTGDAYFAADSRLVEMKV